MNAPLFVTWAKQPEVVGGCESIFQDLAQNLKGKLVTYPYGDMLISFPDMPTNLEFMEEYKSWAFDEYIERYLIDYPNTTIVANCGSINIWRKHETKIINIFNDPYKKAQEVMLKERSISLYVPKLVNKLTELQKKAAKNAINIAVSKIAKEGMEDIGIKCDGIIEHGVNSNFFRPLNKDDLREKYNVDSKKLEYLLVWFIQLKIGNVWNI